MKHAIMATFFVLMTSSIVFGGWQDLLSDVTGNISKSDNRKESASGPQITNKEAVSGLKEALSKGVGVAVGDLGRKDGFWGSKLYRIPMPGSLQTAEKTLRRIGQDKLADDFLLSMNRAAEEATSEATGIFMDSIKQMTINDGISILTGPDDSATAYLRKTSEARLEKRFRPLIESATERVGVTSYYKRMTGQLGLLSAFAGEDVKDLDGYITNRAMDSLFARIAQEEKAIRTNPVERTTDLLKKVFGAYAK